MKNKMFNKDGQPTKMKFKIYCSRNRCKNFIIGRWGDGYGCITTKEGEFDARNQEWRCDKHSEDKEQELKQKMVDSLGDKECDFCGKKGNWISVLRDAQIQKKDGSDIILCNECINNYLNRDYEKIKLKEK